MTSGIQFQINSAPREMVTLIGESSTDASSQVTLREWNNLAEITEGELIEFREKHNGLRLISGLPTNISLGLVNMYHSGYIITDCFDRREFYLICSRTMHSSQLRSYLREMGLPTLRLATEVAVPVNNDTTLLLTMISTGDLVIHSVAFVGSRVIDNIIENERQRGTFIKGLDSIRISKEELSKPKEKYPKLLVNFR